MCVFIDLLPWRGTSVFRSQARPSFFHESKRSVSFIFHQGSTGHITPICFVLLHCSQNATLPVRGFYCCCVLWRWFSTLLPWLWTFLEQGQTCHGRWMVVMDWPGRDPFFTACWFGVTGILDKLSFLSCCVSLFFLLWPSVKDSFIKYYVLQFYSSFKQH